MILLKLDLQDGLGKVQVAVANPNEADRLWKFMIDTGDWFNDAARYRWIMNHSCQHDSAGNIAESWSTHNDPQSFERAIDAAMEAEQVK